ncbi:MAG: helix-hairpin-helix domain-containing protein [Actinomycetota bacterium]
MSRDSTNLAVTVIGLAVVVVLVGVIWFGLGATEAIPQAFTSSDAPVPVESSVRVHVSGAVASPGVVEVPADAIVADAIAAAGGASSSANLIAVNLAAPVRGGEHIIVPDVDGGTAGVSSSSESGVDLNAATATELESLPGVGPVLAERIVGYRDEHGPFATVEDLLDVPGIGESKLATMRSAIAYP